MLLFRTCVILPGIKRKNNKENNKKQTNFTEKQKQKTDYHGLQCKNKSYLTESSSLAKHILSIPQGVLYTH